MKRTSWIVISVTALVMVVAPSATSAAGSNGYQSLTAILGSDGNPASPPVQSRDYTSPNAILGAKGQPEPATSPGENQGFQSLSSIVGPVVPEHETGVVRESSGFDWGDALVGAAVAFGLGLVSLLTVRSLRRRRRAPVESRA